MLPKLHDAISIITLDIFNSAWVVKKRTIAHVQGLEIIDNQVVHITATIYGREYQCRRPIRPVTLAELQRSVWEPMLSRRAASDTHLFVEEVLAFNVHRDLGYKSSGLLCGDVIRTSFVPYENGMYCAVHDRAHYEHEHCPSCMSACRSNVPAMQVA